MSKISFKVFIALFFIVGFIILAFVFSPHSKTRKETYLSLGVTFSRKYSESIGLDWRKNFIDLLDDMRPQKIRIPIYWDLAEKEEGKYDFSDIDWQMQEAKRRGVQVILVIGQKVPRWPECHIPEWALVSDEERKEALLKFIEKSVLHHKNQGNLLYWQVENEPFLSFGKCPQFDESFLDEEIALVRRLDQRKIVMTDSGELSLWFQAAKRADIFGTTMYFNACNDRWGCYNYPVRPVFFQAKRWLMERIVGKKEMVVIELQEEPWLDGWTTDFPVEQQLQSFGVENLRRNIEFAKNSGFTEIYLWGVEWWYWLKEKNNYPAIWEEAEEIFRENIK